MIVKKPLKQRLKQDLVIILAVILLLGGSASVLSRSPYFVPLLALFLVVSFGPYLIEHLQEKNEKKLERRKLVITGIDENGVKKTTLHWKSS